MFWKTKQEDVVEFQPQAEETLIDFSRDYTRTNTKEYGEYIGVLKNTVGFSSENFTRFFIEPISNLIHYCHGIPASYNEHHDYKNGLIRHLLNTALYSTRSSDGSFFSAQTPEEFREQSEIRWRYAAFLGGLCCDLKNVRYTRLEYGPQRWNPLLMGTRQWAQQCELEAWSFEWSEDVNGKDDYLSAVYALNVIPAESIRFLTTFDNSIVDTLFQVLAGKVNEREHRLAELVSNARDTSISQDITTRIFSRKDGSQHMTNVDILLLDAVRRLLKSEWTFNEADSIAWYTDQGLYIVWTRAAKDIVRLLTEEHIYAIPREAHTLAELMLKNGWIEPGPVRELFWELNPHRNNKTMLETIKISDPDAVLLSLKNRPLPISLDSVNCEKGKEEQEKEASLEATDQDAPVQVQADKTITQKADTDSGVVKNNDGKSRQVNKSADDWFNQQGKAGAVLKSIRDELNRKVLKVGRDVFWDNDGLAIIYPDIIQSYDVDPQSIVREMNAKEWLDKDPAKPTASLRFITAGNEQRRVVVLKKEIANHVMSVN